MKKIVMFTAMGLLLSTTIFAEVMVLQDGKTMFFKEDSQIIVSGQTATNIRYNDVSITVPGNQKVQIQKRGNKIWISGTNMKDVEIVGNKISSNGHAIIVISLDTMEVTNVRGDISIINNGVSLNHKNTKNIKNNRKVSTKTETNKVSEPVSFPEISEYVNEISAQQAVQDITDMSQSSPSGI